MGEKKKKEARGERGKEKASEGEGERARYMYTREDGYRVPNRDPRDRVIRIEMNVNPLNTIPGQNTATRGSESGQIRYRGKAGPARARCDPAGCSSLILSLYASSPPPSPSPPPPLPPPLAQRAPRGLP